ncbi:hypothetical protein B0H11DRAFT_1941826 [Mycena galericulata]|nr:hypothetical protein B0H11DRAFT_1941826 [Mycena galericulata]
MLPALPTNFIKRATESERLELLENGELSRAGETIQDNDHASGGQCPGAGRHRVEVVAEHSLRDWCLALLNAENFHGNGEMYLLPSSGPGYMIAYTAVHRAILCAGLFAPPTANSKAWVIRGQLIIKLVWKAWNLVCRILTQFRPWHSINFPTQSANTAAETIREMMTDRSPTSSQPNFPGHSSPISTSPFPWKSSLHARFCNTEGTCKEKFRGITWPRKPVAKVREPYEQRHESGTVLEFKKEPKGR